MQQAASTSGREDSSTRWAMCSGSRTRLHRPSRLLFDRQTGRLPLRIAILQSPCLEAATPQHRHRLKCEHAVWSSAVRDDLLLLWKLAHSTLKVAQRDVDGIRQVP